MRRLFMVSARYPLLIVWLLGVAFALAMISINANALAHGFLYVTAALVALRFIQLSWRDVQHGTTGFAVVQPIAILFAVYLHKPYIALAASGALLVTRILLDAGLDQAGKLPATPSGQQGLQLRQLVRSALASQSPFTRLSARYSLPFSVMVLAIAVAATVISGNTDRALAVLLVGSPFALLHSSSLAMRGAIARAYKFGIAFRSMGALERIADANSVIFGTNGTLLQQFDSVAEVLGKNGNSATDVLAHATGLLKSLKNADVTPFVIAILSHGESLGVKPLHIKHVLNNAGVYSAQYRGQPISLALGPVKKDTKNIWYDLTAGTQIIGSIRFNYAIAPSATTSLQRLAATGIKDLQLLTSAAISAAATSELKQAGIVKISVAASPVATLLMLAENPASVYVAATDAESIAVAESASSILLSAGLNPTASEAAAVLTLSPDISKVATAALLANHGFRIARSATAFGTLLATALIAFAAIGLITPLESALLVLIIPIAVIVLALRAKRRLNILDES